MAPIAPDENLGQMAPLAITHQPAAALRERLFEQFKIEVPVTQHEGRSFVRVSVQAYDSEADLQRLEQSMQALGLFNRWCCVAKPLDPGWEGRFA